jgi:hypothetical protein
VVHIVVLVPFDQFLLRLLQVFKGFVGMPAKFDSLVGCLCLLNMLDGHIGSLIGIPQVGVMEFIPDGGGGDEHTKPSNGSFFHGVSLRWIG